jgi:hypothetical protein
MKTFRQLIEELCEAAKIDHEAIKHHGHMMALYRTRNMLNPQKAARDGAKDHSNRLKKYGVVVGKFGSHSHPDPTAQRALDSGISNGTDVEYDAQPPVRHGQSYAKSINPRTSAKLRKEVGPFTGLAAYRKATGKHN